MAVLGVDGFKKAWVGARLDGRAVTLSVLPDIKAVLAVPDVDVIGIDMPALDACAAAWTAQRMADGEAEWVGDDRLDARRRPMRIHF